MITTLRLLLLPCTLQYYEAAIGGNEALSKVLGAKVPDRWTEFPEAVLVAYDKLKSDPSLTGWFFYLFIHRNERTLMGTGGFKGKPDEKGVVEIGYEVHPNYREQGYATEAAQAFVQFAFEHPKVQKVIAHTLPEYNAAVKVLQKCGMQFAGTEKDPDDGEIWRWEIDRAAWEQRQVPPAPQSGIIL